MVQRRSTPPLWVVHHILVTLLLILLSCTSTTSRSQHLAQTFSDPNHTYKFNSLLSATAVNTAKSEAANGGSGLWSGVMFDKERNLLSSSSPTNADFTTSSIDQSFDLSTGFIHSLLRESEIEEVSINDLLLSLPSRSVSAAHVADPDFGTPSLHLNDQETAETQSVPSVPSQQRHALQIEADSVPDDVLSTGAQTPLHQPQESSFLFSSQSRELYDEAGNKLFEDYYFPISSYDTFAGEATQNFFGTATALGSDFAVVGAPGYSTLSGAIYIYKIQSGNVWTLLTRINSPVEDYDNFGCALSVYNDSILVGGNAFDQYLGQAYLYTRTSESTWTLTQTFNSPLSSGSGYGYSVQLNERHALIGSAVGGAAILYYQPIGGNWTHVQTFTNPEANSIGVTSASTMFGYAISMYHDVIAISANRHNGTQGAVFVYHQTNTSYWYLHSVLRPLSDYGTFYGQSVSLYNGTIAVSAVGYNMMTMSSADSTADTTGYVYIYDISTSYTEYNLTQIIESPAGNRSHFGHSLAMCDDYLVIGATGFPYGKEIGAAFLYYRSAPVIDTTPIWVLNMSLPNPSLSSHSAFGMSVAINSQSLSIGADAASPSYTGAIYFASTYLSPHGTGAPSFAPSPKPSYASPTSYPSGAPSAAPSPKPTPDTGIQQFQFATTKDKNTTQIGMIIVLIVAILLCVSALSVIASLCARPAVEAPPPKKKKKTEDDEEESEAIIVGPFRDHVPPPPGGYPPGYVPRSLLPVSSMYGVGAFAVTGGDQGKGKGKGEKGEGQSDMEREKIKAMYGDGKGVPAYLQSYYHRPLTSSSTDLDDYERNASNQNYWDKERARLERARENDDDRYRPGAVSVSGGERDYAAKGSSVKGKGDVARGLPRKQSRRDSDDTQDYAGETIAGDWAKNSFYTPFRRPPLSSRPSVSTGTPVYSPYHLPTTSSTSPPSPFPQALSPRSVMGMSSVFDGNASQYYGNVMTLPSTSSSGSNSQSMYNQPNGGGILEAAREQGRYVKDKARERGMAESESVADTPSWLLDPPQFEVFGLQNARANSYYAPVRESVPPRTVPPVSVPPPGALIEQARARATDALGQLAAGRTGGDAMAGTPVSSGTPVPQGMLIEQARARATDALSQLVGRTGAESERDRAEREKANQSMGPPLSVPPSPLSAGTPVSQGLLVEQARARAREALGQLVGRSGKDWGVEREGEDRVKPVPLSPTLSPSNRSPAMSRSPSPTSMSMSSPTYRLAHSHALHTLNEVDESDVSETSPVEVHLRDPLPVPASSTSARVLSPSVPISPASVTSDTRRDILLAKTSAILNRFAATKSRILEGIKQQERDETVPVPVPVSISTPPSSTPATPVVVNATGSTTRPSLFPGRGRVISTLLSSSFDELMSLGRGRDRQRDGDRVVTPSSPSSSQSASQSVSQSYSESQSYSHSQSQSQSQSMSMSQSLDIRERDGIAEEGGLGSRAMRALRMGSKSRSKSKMGSKSKSKSSLLDLSILPSMAPSLDLYDVVFDKSVDAVDDFNPFSRSNHGSFHGSFHGSLQPESKRRSFRLGDGERDGVGDDFIPSISDEDGSDDSSESDYDEEDRPFQTYLRQRVPTPPLPSSASNSGSGAVSPAVDGTGTRVDPNTLALLLDADGTLGHGSLPVSETSYYPPLFTPNNPLKLGVRKPVASGIGATWLEKMEREKEEKIERESSKPTTPKSGGLLSRKGSSFSAKSSWMSDKSKEDGDNNK